MKVEPEKPKSWSFFRTGNASNENKELRKNYEEWLKQKEAILENLSFFMKKIENFYDEKIVLKEYMRTINNIDQHEKII